MKTTSVLTALGATIIGSRAVMNKTFRIRTLLAASIAVLLLTPMTSSAIDVEVLFDFHLNSNDPNDGFGSMSGFFQLSTDPNGNPEGINFTAPMPKPDFFFQKDTLTEFGNGEVFDTTGVVDPNGTQVNAVGFSNQIFANNPLGGSPNGFYMGWGLGGPNGGDSRTVVLEGSFDGTDYTLPVELTYASGDFQWYLGTHFDNLTGDPNTGLGGFDVVTEGGQGRWAGFVGNSLDGHRHTDEQAPDDSDDVYTIGQDIFPINSGGIGNDGSTFELDNDGKGELVDGSGFGDNVGVTFGLTAYDDTLGENGSIYLGNVSFGGALLKNAVLIDPPIVVPGDVNFDGVADILDFNIILENFNQEVETQLEGDLSSDDFVDFTDFDLWKSASLAAVGSLATNQAVPEPSTAVLVLMFTAVCTLRRRSRAHLSPV